MLDIKFIRQNEARVKEGMRSKGEENTAVVDELIDTDKHWRAVLQKTDDLRNETNVKSSKIGRLMGEGKEEQAQEIIKHTSKLKQQIKELEIELEQLKKNRDTLLLQIPNMPHETVPVGKSEHDNKIFKTWGEPIAKEWRQPHWNLTEQHGWVDFKRGAKVAGAGFPFYIGPVARLQRSLINYFLNKAKNNSYTEIQTPYFINEDSARGTGQIPDKEDMMYEVPRDEFYAIPTGEVPITNFHRDEIIAAEDMPLQYAAYTPCWRREAGSYGKEVRGLNRLHQFDKVEIVQMVYPERSYEALEDLRQYAESLLEALNLPYRTLLMCTADMGFTQSKKYDLEVWSAGQQQWLEVSSCSNFEAFQARRMQLRYRDEHGNLQVLHTLNGSALALPRMVAAILENYQQQDGSVAVPEVLEPFMECKILENNQ